MNKKLKDEIKKVFGAVMIHPNPVPGLKPPEPEKRVYAKNPNLDDFDRLARLNRVLSSCVDKRMALLAEAVLLGYPKFVDGSDPPTAGVGVTKDGRVYYAWNRAFFDTASDNAILYISMHESIHILMWHPQRREKREPRLWNIAVDVVDNEILDDVFPKSDLMTVIEIDNDPDLKNRITTTVWGHTFCDQTAEEVYDILNKEKKKQINKLIQNRLNIMASGGDPGPGGEVPEDSLPGTLDSHDDWDNVISGDIQEELNGIVEELAEHEDDLDKGVFRKGSKNKSGQMAGQGSSRLKIELEAIKKPKKVSWQTMLRGRIASVRKPNDGENWARPHRKLYSVYPDIMLPGAHETETLTSSILNSMDTSGSMSNELIAELAGIVSSCPSEYYEVHNTWFDTSVYECTDLKSPLGRGGTEFECIDRVCKGEAEIQVDGQPEGIKLTRYPDVVICLTDGYNYSNEVVQYPERWIFMITKGGTDRYVKHLVGATIYWIED